MIFLYNGFKLSVNEFNLRKYGITNQNTFRYSGWADETAKQRKSCKCHIDYLSACKETELDGDSAE